MPDVPATSVPFPVFGDQGFILPDELAVLRGAQADLNRAFGGVLNFTTTGGSVTNATPQGQWTASEAAIIGDSFAMFAWLCNMVDPAYSSGRMQDAIGRLYFIARFPGKPTVQPCLCLGRDGLELPIGALARDPNGVLWVSLQAGKFANGSVTLNFACQNDGPTPAPAVLEIYQAIFGWDSIAPTGDAVLGQSVETAAQFEARRALSTGLNSMGPLNAIYAAVAAVSDVIDVYTAQNNTGFAATVGGVVLAAHSIYVCVAGGSADAVALAIFTRKPPGVGMTGNTTVTISDPNPAYQAPVPRYSITYQVATVKSFAVVVHLTNGPTVPANAATLVKTAIVAAFAGADGGPRAKIGSTVYGSRYVAPVTALSNTFNSATGRVLPGWSSAVVGIKLGIDGAKAAVTGSISGNTLTVSAVASGSIGVGDLVEGTGVQMGTLVSAFVGGTGGTGTYLLSGSGQLAASQAIAITGLADEVTMNIDQVPSVAATNIHLILDQ